MAINEVFPRIILDSNHGMEFLGIIDQNVQSPKLLNRFGYNILRCPVIFVVCV
mgnify:CR=1 FL=1